jgi:hypothetical protein
MLAGSAAACDHAGEAATVAKAAAARKIEILNFIIVIPLSARHLHRQPARPLRASASAATTNLHATERAIQLPV